MAFVRLPKAGEQAQHARDPNPRNNSLENLKWGMPVDNATVDCLRQRGKYPSAKLYAHEVRIIRQLRAQGMKLTVLAQRFGMTAAGISMICRRKYYKWVD
jgi:hypothetical protein